MSTRAYPTLGQVEAADRIQLARWWRFLPSPGESAIGCKNFPDVFAGEAAIQKRIMERFEAMGGWTPEVSKQVGWQAGA